MDWNGDGKFDHKDDAFYNNVLSGNKSNATSSTNKKIATNNSTKYKVQNKQTCQSNSNGWIWFAFFCMVYVIFKIIF